MRQVFRAIIRGTSRKPAMAAIEDEPSLKKLKLNLSEDIIVQKNVKEEPIPQERYEDMKAKESDCAITEYISNHKGFTGVLKERYSDFVVHEITKTGEIVKLTDLDVPKNDCAEEKAPSSCPFLTPEHLASISAVEKGEEMNFSVDVSSMTKEERTSLHRFIAENYDSVETNTVKTGDNTKIVASKRNRNSRKRSEWPPTRGDYTHFTLYQESRGTFDAVYTVAKYTHFNAKNFQYAGSKDKRGISSQRVSAFRLPAQKLLKINESLMKALPPLAVGNVEYKKDKVSLGDLSGNRFDLVVKQVTYSDEADVAEAMNAVLTKGFLNYFGTQRFGFRHMLSSTIGLSILRENWKEAVDLMLAERPVDTKPSFRKEGKSYNECMQLWKKTGDAEQVLKEFLWKSSNEGFLLKALSKLKRDGQANNYYSAIMAIPRNNRTMYLHSYQSLVWNKLANFRLKHYGTTVVPGDLLLFDQDAPQEEEEDDDCNDDEINVKPIYANESNIHQATIFDVVLPVPGSKVWLPKNDVKDKLKELLREDGLTLNSFSHRAKTFMLKGAYRKLIEKPKDLVWSLGSYEDPKVALIQTDLQAINGVSSDKLEDKSLHDKKLVKFSFSLSSSTYATIFLRELMKIDVMDHSLNPRTK